MKERRTAQHNRLERTQNPAHLCERGEEVGPVLQADAVIGMLLLTSYCALVIAF